MPSTLLVDTPRNKLEMPNPHPRAYPEPLTMEFFGGQLSRARYPREAYPVKDDHVPAFPAPCPVLYCLSSHRHLSLHLSGAN